jgi:hypothetical protein
MNAKNEVTYDPHSLRNTLRIALGDKWTVELEDQLFWPVSMFCNNSCERVREELRRDIRKALGLEQ